MKERTNRARKREPRPLTPNTIFAILGVLLYTTFVGIQYKLTQEPELDNLHPLLSKPQREGPFPMPIHGKAYEIFQPFYDMDETKKSVPLFAPPQDFLKAFEERISYIDPMVARRRRHVLLSANEYAKRYAKSMYLDMLKSHVTALVFWNTELSVKAI